MTYSELANMYHRDLAAFFNATRGLGTEDMRALLAYIRGQQPTT